MGTHCSGPRRCFLVGASQGRQRHRFFVEFDFEAVREFEAKVIMQFKLESNSDVVESFKVRSARGREGRFTPTSLLTALLAGLVIALLPSATRAQDSVLPSPCQLHRRI